MRAPSAGLAAAAVLGTTVLPVRHLELLYLYGMQRGLGNRAPLGRQERTVAELQGDMTRPLITITIIKPHFVGFMSFELEVVLFHSVSVQP